MEKEKKYKVTNKAKDVRKFRDGFLGKDILVGPNKFILTDHPPEENEVWKVETVEQLEKKTENKKSSHKKIKSQEVKKMNEKKLENDSSSN